jgi:cyclase
MELASSSRPWRTPVRTRLIAAAAAIVALGAAAQAQQLQPLAPAPDFDKVVIRTTDLGNRIYMLEGAGGNVTVAVADDGVIMVDSQFAPLYGKLKAAIAALTPQPVRYLIITHFHRDHTGGNEAFGKDGAVIVAHENVKTRLASGTRNGLTGGLVPPVPEIALPTQTYKDTMTLRLQGRTAELKHPVDVHTDGDTYIWFADANVLVAGDLVFFGRYPNIDFLYGGSIDGMIRGVDGLLEFAKDDTRIVPGHGPAGTTAMMRDYRRMRTEARDRIATLKAAGKTEDEVVAAKPNADYDVKFDVDARAIGNFVRVVYRSLN